MRFIAYKIVKKQSIVYIKNKKQNHIIYGMGVDYNINNLKKGNYDIDIYAKEYKNGKLFKEHNLSNIFLDFQDKILKISIYQEDKDIKIAVNDSDYNHIELDFFKHADTGIALSILDIEKELEENVDIPIAVYSIGGKGNTTESVDIDENYELGSNEGDLVIYLKMKKSN